MASLRDAFDFGGGSLRAVAAVCRFFVDLAVELRHVTVRSSPEDVRDEKEFREASGHATERTLDLYRVDKMVTARQELPDRSAVAINRCVVQRSDANCNGC
jgi:hypothetical protein